MQIAQRRDNAWFVVQRRLEFAFVVGAVALLIGAPHVFYTGFDVGGAASISEAVEGSRAYQLTMAPIYMIAAAVLISYCWGRSLYLVRTNFLLMSFVLLLMVSPLWAELTGLGIRRSYAVVGNTIIAFYIVCRFSPEEFLRILGWAMAVTLALCILVVLVSPASAFAGWGAFRGALGHKNDLGQAMVLGAITFWALRSVDGWRGYPALAGFSLCTLFAFWSVSASAWVVYAGLFAIALPLLRQLSSVSFTPSLRVVWTSICIAFLLLLLVLFYQTGLEFVGKDATLTNRTVIWEKSLKFGWERPWLGAGYGTFWEGWAGRAWLLIGGRIGHAHNAYVEIWLQLGFIGAGLLVLLLFRLGSRLGPLIVYQRDHFAVFSGLVLAYVVAYGMVVKIVPDHRRAIWLVFVTCLLYAGIAVRSYRQKLGTRSPRKLPAQTAAKPGTAT